MLKRSKYSFHDLCAKHTPSATLTYIPNKMSTLILIIMFSWEGGGGPKPTKFTVSHKFI